MNFVVRPRDTGHRPNRIEQVPRCPDIAREHDIRHTARSRLSRVVDPPHGHPRQQLPQDSALRGFDPESRDFMTSYPALNNDETRANVNSRHSVNEFGHYAPSNVEGRLTFNVNKGSACMDDRQAAA